MDTHTKLTIFSVNLICHEWSYFVDGTECCEASTGQHGCHLQRECVWNFDEIVHILDGHILLISEITIILTMLIIM